MKKISSAIRASAAAVCVAFGAQLFASQDANAFDDLFGPRSPGIHDWSGLYVGGQVGWVHASMDVTYNGLGISNDLNDDGILGGGHIGYNIQNGDGIFGVVGDFNFADLDASNVSLIAGATGFYNTMEINFMGSIRGKFGVALNDRIVAYGTGGVAFLNAEHTNAAFAAAVIGPAVSSGDQTYVGLTAGGGFDLALNDWISAFVEYRWTGYGDESYTTLGGFVVTPHDVEISTHQIQAGISFKLGHMFGGMGY